MRRGFRISGIVRTAHWARQMLSRPLSPAERGTLHRQIGEALQEIDALLQKEGATIRHLPPPSQRAYEFLKSAWSVTSSGTQPPADDLSPQELPAASKSVTFRGLRAFLDQVLDDIARLIHQGRFNPTATFKIVSDTANRLNDSMARQDPTSTHFSLQTRSLVGWFRYFAVTVHFEVYHEAVRRMQRILSQLPHTARGWRAPGLVHFAPTRQMYRWKGHQDGARVLLPTPMITFDDEMLLLVGRQMMGERQARLAVTEAMMAPPYQRMIQALEEAGGGVAERTRGMVHDLAEVFDRVNLRYFEGQMARPRLAWSRGLNRRVFGHYHMIQDTVTLNAALDSSEVPGFVLDHVMHHELLHKKLGLEQRGDRHHAHTPEFREQERFFERYADASAFLEGMSRR